MELVECKRVRLGKTTRNEDLISAEISDRVDIQRTFERRNSIPIRSPLLKGH